MWGYAGQDVRAGGWLAGWLVVHFVCGLLRGLLWSGRQVSGCCSVSRALVGFLAACVCALSLSTQIYLLLSFLLGVARWSLLWAGDGEPEQLALAGSEGSVLFVDTFSQICLHWIHSLECPYAGTPCKLSEGCWHWRVQCIVKVTEEAFRGDPTPFISHFRLCSTAPGCCCTLARCRTQPDRLPPGCYPSENSSSPLPRWQVQGSVTSECL